MTAFDFLKKKKPKEKPAEPVKKPKEETSIEKVAKAKPITAKKEARVLDAYRILKSPHITEKATDLAEKNQYTFKLWPRAGKTEVKKSIEGLYGVDVLSVKIINIPRKKRRTGKISGWRAGCKKAIVRVKEGQKIEVLPR